jgi:hypothetical protein
MLGLVLNNTIDGSIGRTRLFKLRSKMSRRGLYAGSLSSVPIKSRNRAIIGFVNLRLG